MPAYSACSAELRVDLVAAYDLALMRIAIVGSGGVGGYFGGRLAATGADVTFLARGAHLEAMRTHGLRIDSPKGDVHLPHVKADRRSVRGRPGRYRVLRGQAVRHRPRARAAAAARRPGHRRHPAAERRRQRGDADASRRRAAHRRRHLLRVGGHRGAGRHPAHGDGPSDLRRAGRTRPPRLEWLLEACRPAGFQATLSTDIIVDIWTKFVRLSVFSGMTAVTRSPLGVVRDDPELFAMLQEAVREAMAVAHAKGIAVPRLSRRRRGRGLSRAAAADQVVDARGSRARPPPRAAVAERRRRPHRTRGRRGDADASVHHHGARPARQRK